MVTSPVGCIVTVFFLGYLTSSYCEFEFVVVEFVVMKAIWTIVVINSFCVSLISDCGGVPKEFAASCLCGIVFLSVKRIR